MLLRIAGITISISSDDPTLAPRAGVPAARFVVAGNSERPDLDLAIERVAAMPETGGAPLFDSGAVWSMFDDGARLRIDCHSHLFGDAPYKVAYFDRDFTAGRVLLRADVFGD